MNLSKRLVAVAATGLSLTGVLAVSAAPAQAVSGPQWVFTKDGNPGGQATYIDRGDRVIVCDVQRDGYNVVGSVLYPLKNGQTARIELTNSGDKRDCVQGSLKNVQENVYIALDIGLYKGRSPRNGIRFWNYKVYMT